MKATGIVRRIDDLGRVVVPKEIRRTLRIREGEPLLTTLINMEENAETAENQAFCENAFISGIVGFASRLGI